MLKGYIKPRPDRGPSKPVVFSQDKARERRRTWLAVRYDGSNLDLAAEVEAIAGPVAEAVASEPCPKRYADDAQAVADAVHRLIATVSGIVSARQSRAALESLNAEDAARARQAFRALAATVPRSDIGVGKLADGSWVAALVETARPYGVPLGRALKGADPRNGLASQLSDELVTELRELDRAALAVVRKVERARFARAAHPVPDRTVAAADTARAQLAALGIEL
ncbi:hypothetical protein HQ314_00130 [Rhodococcus sp. BP-332]|uniref:hypothetical protein n=1 Tax=Rhodococcus sp. BP-332 TaxID=2739447 RepID=UPI001C9B16D6|nr:hypothetical protein [Rhodococcus sp. BP-332]MBY6675322.1 hypothetical protein [Rhodococcus sp. BP-332]